MAGGSKLTSQQRVVEGLANFAAASAAQQEAYAAFLVAAQKFDWIAAAELQIKVSASQDAAMDAFMSACLAMQEGKGGA